MQRKMQFVAYEMAAILQNIGSRQAITKKDVANAVALAYLSIYPGNTIVSPRRGCNPLGYTPHVILHYVKGTGVNIGEQKWAQTTMADGGTPVAYAYNETSHDTTIIPWSNAAQTASSIYPGLSIGQKGEVKILAECSLWYDWNGTGGWSLINGKSPKSVSSREIFNFLFFTPTGGGDNKRAFFPSVAIFTPNTGAFSEAAPW